MAKQDITKASGAAKGLLQSSEATMGNLASSAARGYGDFAQTGGITPQEQLLTRQRTQRGISSLYDAMRQNLEQRKRIQGGYSPGYGATQAQMGRDTAAQTGAAVGNTELGLLQQIRQGRLAGLGGLSNLSGMYAGLIPPALGTQAKLAVAKPGWMDMLSQGLGIAGDIAGGFTGFGGGGGGGGYDPYAAGSEAGY